MAISVFLKSFARRCQLPTSRSSSPAYESVFRNVNTSCNSSLLGKTFTSLGSRAFCSKPDHNDPVVQNQPPKLPDSNLTKVVFKYVCADDESREASRPFKPLVRKSNTGIRVSAICLLYPSLFKEHIRSIMDSALDFLNVDCMIHHIEKIEDLLSISPGSGCGMRWNLDEIFAIRIWEKITNADKHVLETIVCELKRNGFDFAKDPVAIQKVEEAVERAVAQMTNVIKLNLPVPDGEPDISTTISWSNCAGLPETKTITLPPNTLKVRRLQ
ncbi:hypothetical protein MKW94_009896 [Papaver nudicaule]|uniref:Uncharacterized protein n=1 Tax=Papaver nudicaule TaxID=74823 RepID=A0AA41VAH4_PAPNU|nr:hypothetical protein [Papaver nudicaule]